MNSLEQFATEKAKPSGPVQLASNWIEVFAIPIASSIMETQPIALALQLVLPTITGDNSVLLLDAATITLLMLGMQWWIMLVKHFVQRGMKESQSTLLQVLGLVAALVILVATHLALLDHIFVLIIGVVLLGWFWKRAIDRVKAGLSDEHLITAFKVGFITLLVVLGFAVIYTPVIDLRGELAQSLPIFFLSGMVALSFTRIAVVKKENARHPGSAPKNTTDSWIFALTVTWIAIVVIGFALEALSIQTLITLLNPLWELLGLIVGAILFILGLLVEVVLYVIGFIMLLIARFLPQTKPSIPKLQSVQPIKVAAQTQHANGAGPLIGRIALVIVVIVVLAFAIRFARHKLRRVEDNSEEEEEVREGLDMNSILKARREERRKRRQKKAFELEALDPNSVRARYRDFLQSVADKEEDLERRSDETPVEYQQRLQEVLKKLSAQGDSAPPDPEILAELTRAYARERYGGKRTDDSEKSYLRTWVPHLD